MKTKDTENKIIVDEASAYYSMSKATSKYVFPFFRTLLLIALTFVIIYPLLYMMSMAFRPIADVSDPQVIWIPNSLTLFNIKTTIESIDYFKLLGNSLFISGVCTIIQLFITMLVGYAFGRFDFWLKKFWLVVIALTLIVPAHLIALPTYHAFINVDFMGIIQAIKGSPSGISIIDSPLAFIVLALFGQGIRSGLFILIFMQVFKAMPRELEEAALIDGAGFVKTYVRVMVPNAGTAAIVVGLLSLVWYWNDYYLSNIYIGAQFKTLSTVLANIRPMFAATMGSSATMDPSQMVVMEQSGALLTMLPLLIIYLIAQRKFCESIERVGIVG